MHTAYMAITVVLALLVAFSGLAKIARKADVVKTIHEVIGVPMKYFLLLAVCEFAGAIGLVVGIWLPGLGVAAGIGLILYFVGAVASHLRVGDVKGIGPAVFMLVLSGGALALRFLTM
ncbi:MAG: DoxX family protein [Candidatus Acidiferrales bacterium]